MLEAFATALDTDPASLLTRNPLDPDGVWTVWDQIPPIDRPRAIEVLKALARTGTMIAVLIGASATGAFSQTDAVSQFKSCVEAIYNSPVAAPLRPHVPLDIRQATLAQLSDRSLATTGEIAALQIVEPQQKACQQQALDSIRAASPEAAALLARTYAESEDDLILLVQRRMTWGDRTRRARDRALALQSRLADLSATAAQRRAADARDCRDAAMQAVATDSRARADLDPHFGQNQGLFGGLAKGLVAGAARSVAEAAFADCMRARGWR